MDSSLNTIHLQDCVTGMNALPEGSIDLAFADPPFNIGYQYDVYDDRQEREHYLDWCNRWIGAVYQALKPTGTFWLAIGDEYAAELKLASQAAGFLCRSWVIWYYTFGVNCSKKFSRSHAHLFHFVKDPKSFTFREDDLENRIPSARQLVYNDKRANPKGRLPDDTWIIRPRDVAGELLDDGIPVEDLPPATDADATWTLRPQDMEQCFSALEDTWYFPRVAGTFKERAGFHGCQMPEQLLGRIIRYCSEPGEIVLDPFSGSATTLAVAKKLHRQFVGFDISEDYITFGLQRLAEVREGDPLEGAPEPTMSAPKTDRGRKTKPRSKASKSKQTTLNLEPVSPLEESEIVDLLQGVKQAFQATHDGFSADRLITDPELNAAFVSKCEQCGLSGDIRSWNVLLLRLRKSGQLQDVPTERYTVMSWKKCDPYLFASEIAWQTLSEDNTHSLDEIFCDPESAQKFDQIADQLAPGKNPWEYRWAALKLRKASKTIVHRAMDLDEAIQASLLEEAAQSQEMDVESVSLEEIADSPGLYLLSGTNRPLYWGEAINLRQRLEQHLKSASILSNEKSITLKTMSHPDWHLGDFSHQCFLVHQFNTVWNLKHTPELASV